MKMIEEMKKESPMKQQLAQQLGHNPTHMGGPQGQITNSGNLVEFTGYPIISESAGHQMMEHNAQAEGSQMINSENIKKSMSFGPLEGAPEGMNSLNNELLKNEGFQATGNIGSMPGNLAPETLAWYQANMNNSKDKTGDLGMRPVDSDGKLGNDSRMHIEGEPQQTNNSNSPIGDGRLQENFYSTQGFSQLTPNNPLQGMPGMQGPQTFDEESKS